jgi:hypothetical protein
MNIWRKPPGGYTPEMRRARRHARLQKTVAVLLVVAIAGAGARAGLLKSDPVSEAHALQLFRSDDSSEGVDRSQDERRGERAATRNGNTNEERNTASAPRERSRTPAAAQPSAEEPVRTSTPSPRNEDHQTMPAEGVYTWHVEGFEETSGGMRRELPKESHRIITHGDGGTWVDHHIFSNQRESWFEVGRSDEGLVTQAVRNRVQFGAVEVDRTVTFNPAALGARMPFRLNDTWAGEWTGRTEGEYEARTFEHGYITIDGERVEVWGTEIVMHMRGEVEGEVTTRSWIAPAYGLVVKQQQQMLVASGPGEYRMEWTGQVESLTPTR